MKIVLNYKIDLDQVPLEIAERLNKNYLAEFLKFKNISESLFKDLVENKDILYILDNMKVARKLMIKMDEQLEDYTIILAEYAKAKANIELSQREIKIENLKGENESDVEIEGTPSKG